MSTRVRRQLTEALLLMPILLIPSIAVSSPREPQDVPPGALKQTAQAPQSGTQVVKEPPAFGIEDATPVKLRINRNISSGDAHVNETVDFEVLEEIKVKDVVVIPRGGTAWGTVTEAQPKRRMGRGGRLTINIDNVRLTSGEKVALRAVKDVKGGGRTGAIVATTIVFAPAGAVALLFRGKDITISKGTEIIAYINGDISLDPKKFVTPTAANSEETETTGIQPSADAASVQNGNSASTVLATVDIKSTPDGAEITVDDEKFAGNTPASLRLVAGDHKIKLEKPGFKTWERTLTLGAGATATLSPTLEKQE